LAIFGGCKENQGPPQNQFDVEQIDATGRVRRCQPLPVSGVGASGPISPTTSAKRFSSIASRWREGSPRRYSRVQCASKTTGITLLTSVYRSLADFCNMG